MANTPTTKFPIRYARGLPREAQQDIYRDFQALATAIDVAKQATYDAIVNPTATTDDTTSRTFRTVFAAVKYLADTAGLTDITIGIAQTTTTITETGNYAGSTGTLTVRLIGIGSSYAPANGGAFAGAQMPQWDLHLFHENSKWRNLIIAGVAVIKNTGAVSATPTFFNSSSMTVFATDSVFDGQGASSSTVTCNIAGITANNCAFYDVGFDSTSNLNACWVQLVRPTGTVTWAASIFWLGVTLSQSTCTIALTTPSTVVMHGSYGNGLGNITKFTISAARSVSAKMGTPLDGQFSLGNGCNLNITSSALRSCVIEGYFNDITVPGTILDVARISAVVDNNADITGPANIAIGAGTSSSNGKLTVRGDHVAGTFVSQSSDIGTTLSYVGATRSVITASLHNPSTGGSGKPYAFDSGSSHNILVLEQDAFTNAGTDAGSSNLVITDAGLAPSGAAGGDLTGTYPNPTLAAVITAGGPVGDGTHVPHITWDAKGRLTAVTSIAISGAGIDTSAVHSGDAAGGDLTGTYPSPTLAAVVTGATKGTASKVPQITYNNKGQITAVTEVSISGAGIDSTAIHSGDAAGGDLTGTLPNPTLAAVITAGGPTGDATHVARVTWDAKGRLTAVSSVAISGAGIDTSAIHSGDAAGGDLTGTYANPTLAATAVTAASYGAPYLMPRFTVDTKGRLTAASNVRDHSAAFMFGSY